MAEASRTEDTGITLRIKFKSETIDKFVERYGVDLSPGGIFIRTREPLAVGSKLTFEFTLVDGTPLMAGQGVIAWVRDPDSGRAGVAPGMGIRFERLSGDSPATLNRLLAEKSKRQGAPPVRYTSPVMEAVSGPVPPAPVSPFKETPSSMYSQARANATLAGLGPIPGSLARPGGPGGRTNGAAPGLTRVEPSESAGGGDAYGSDDKTEIAAMPPSFYFDKADQALADEPGSLAKALPRPPRDTADDETTNPRATAGRPPARGGTPAFGAPRPDAADAPGRAVFGSAAAEMGARVPTPPLGAALPNVEGDAPDRPEATPMPYGRAAEGERMSLDDGGPLSSRTPTPIGVPSALANADDAFAGSEARHREGLGDLSVSEMGGRSFSDERPLMAFQGMTAERKGKGGLVVGLVAAGAVVLGGVWLAPRFLGKSDAPAVMPVAEAPAAQERSATNPTAEPSGGAPLGAAPGTPSPSAAPGTPSPSAAAPVGAAEVKRQESEAATAASGAGAPAAAKAPPGSPAAAAVKKPASPPRPIAAKPPAVRPARSPRTAKDVIAEANARAEGAAAPLAAEPGAEAPAESATPASPEAPTTSAAEELYWLHVKTTPPGADVLIDGQLEGKTPFQRRIFDTGRSYAISLRKTGFEPIERTLSASDSWTKKGNTRTLTITARLTKASEPAAATPPPAVEPAAPEAPRTEEPAAPATPPPVEP